MKKYIVEYASGATGYGWTQEYDRAEEFEDFVKECRSDASAAVRVFDNELKAFIYWKDTLTFKEYINLMFCSDRDLRTTDRKHKAIV